MPVLAPIDLTQTPDGNFTTWPAGRYLVEVRGAPKVSVSKGDKTRGAPTVNVRFVSPEGDPAGSVFETFILHDTVLWKWKAFLKAVGVSDDVLAGLVEFETDDLAGAQLYITVEIEGERVDPESGRTYDARNRIKKYEPAETGSWAGI